VSPANTLPRSLFPILLVGVLIALLGLRVNAMSDYTLARVVQDFLNALTLGSLYALIALGYTMVYGIIRLINFAHGEIFMLVEALILSMVATGVAGVLLDLVAYRPLRGAPRESMLITAIAASFFLQNMGQLIFGPRLRGFHVETVLNQTLSLQIGTEKVYFTGILLVVPVITALLLAILNYFVTRSRLGKAMRATAQDAEVAQMMGVNVNQVITFLIGSVLAAAAGVMYAIRFGQINPLMGLLPGIKAFTAAVIGGIGIQARYSADSSLVSSRSTWSASFRD